MDASAEMRVVCAWCGAERRGTSVEDGSTSHGICSRHQELVFSQLPSRSFPGIRLLLVVAPREGKLYEYLAGRFAAVAGMKVIMERRQGDRRRQGRPVEMERRRRDRRMRYGERSDLGYTLIRFGPALPLASANIKP